MKHSFFFFFLLAGINVFAQTAGINGSVKDESGNAVEAVGVGLKGTSIATTTNSSGQFELNNLNAGSHTLVFIFLGYQQQEKTVQLKNGETVTLNIKLHPSELQLNEVQVTGKTQTQEVREQAYTITAIDVKPLQNLNLDVNAVLNRTTGIRIRQEGGLGSDFSFSLNGFTGNQVRFFLDGMPTDYLGGSLTFNNIPVNIIERIEVYKGVVPVSLGADALGGAVNVVTGNNAKDILDVSYSFGSFNTHHVVASRASFKKSFVLNASGFFNYSANNYTIDASLIDKNTGKIGEPQPVKRFNDAYRSSSVMVETGVVNKPYADRLLVGVIASENRKEVQQGANMTKVAGEVFRTDRSFTPMLKYQKNDLLTKDLSLKISAFYSYNQSMTVDTGSRIYDWDGSYTVKDINVLSGELSWDKTKFRFNDHATLTTATLEYILHKRHTFTLSNTYSWFQRQGEDPLSYNPIPFNNPNTLSKNITGVSYKIRMWKDRWHTTVFAKAFYMKAGVYQDDAVSDDFKLQGSKVFEHGEGIATALFVTRDLQLKLSFENTCRLPESYELFGDGLLLVPNTSLEPERSRNFNAGLLYGKKFGNHLFNAEAGFIYRAPQNMVRLVSIAILSQYENLSSAGITGYEGSVRYGYKKILNIEVNATYQNLRNTNETTNNFPDPLYLDRLPNIPYLFGNVLIGLQTNEIGKYKIRVGFDWSTLYVEEFYLKWPSQGNMEDKFVIPRQLAHDASVTLTSHAGKYNVSFSCFNIADSKLYDNFKVQKPGRSFNVKLRFYLSNFKNK